MNHQHFHTHCIRERWCLMVSPTASLHSYISVPHTNIHVSHLQYRIECVIIAKLNKLNIYVYKMKKNKLDYKNTISFEKIKTATV